MILLNEDSKTMLLKITSVQTPETFNVLKGSQEISQYNSSLFAHITSVSLVFYQDPYSLTLKEAEV